MLRGKHNKPKETKKLILKYILSQTDRVEEPRLRNFLKEEYNISDQKSIKKHLEELRNLGCIGKSQEEGLANIWTIEFPENVFKIVDEYKELLDDISKNQVIINKLFEETKPINIPEVRGFFESIIQFSPTFLKKILMPKYFDIFKKTWLEFNQFEMNAQDIDLLVYLELAKHSILNDGMEGNDMQKALTYIKEKENKLPLNLPSIATSVVLFFTALKEGFEQNSKKMEENSLEEKVQSDPEVEAKIRAEIEEENKKRKEEKIEEWLKKEGVEWLKKKGFVRAESTPTTK